MKFFFQRGLRYVVDFVLADIVQLAPSSYHIPHGWLCGRGNFSLAVDLESSKTPAISLARLHGLFCGGADLVHLRAQCSCYFAQCECARDTWYNFRYLQFDGPLGHWWGQCFVNLPAPICVAWLNGCLQIRIRFVGYHEWAASDCHGMSSDPVKMCFSPKPCLQVVLLSETVFALLKTVMVHVFSWTIINMLFGIWSAFWCLSFQSYEFPFQSYWGWEE